MISARPPKVSIITGYYNRSAVVDRTLRSLANQSLRDIEIIVFDDASTDDTPDRIRAFIDAEGDDRFRTVFQTQNLGFTRSLIGAIQKARGDYIAIQGSGDVSHVHRLAKQAAHLDANPAVSVVGCYFVNIDEASGARVQRTPDASKVNLASLRSRNIFAHGEVMMRRSTYEAAGGYRPVFKFSADYDLWLRMIQFGRFYTVPEVLYDRYMLNDGVSYNPRKAIEMVKFHTLGWRLSFDQSVYRELVTDQGELRQPIDQVIPDSEHKVRRKLRRLAMRFAYFRQFESARYIASRISPALVGKSISLIVSTSAGQALVSLAARMHSIVK